MSRIYVATDSYFTEEHNRCTELLLNKLSGVEVIATTDWKDEAHMYDGKVFAVECDADSEAILRDLNMCEALSIREGHEDPAFIAIEAVLNK